VQESFEMPDRKRRQWLKVLLSIAIALSILFPAGFPNTPQEGSGTPVQIPASWRQWAKTDTLPSQDILKSLKQGIDRYLNERYSAALEILPSEQNAKSIGIGDYILLYRGKSHLMLEHYKEALNDFRLLQNYYADSSLFRDALLGECQSLLKLSDPKPVFAILKNPQIGSDSESLFCQARALDLTGEKEKAMDLYLQIYSQYPKSKFSPLAEHNLLQISPAALKGKRDYGARLQRAENLLEAKDAAEARPLLLALGRVGAPDAQSAQKQIVLLADAEYRLGKASIALTRVRKVTAEDPAIHAKALRLEGICYRKLNRPQSLLAQRDKALKLYPGSPDTEELCYSVATYFDVNCDTSSAKEAYRLLTEHFPKGRYAERTLWKSSLFPYFEKDYDEAARRLWRYLITYPNPISGSPAMYWLGRCYEMTGNFKNARYLYKRVQALANDSYYGQSAHDAEASLGKSGQTGASPISEIDFARVIATCDGIRLSAVLLADPSKASIPVIERARLLWAANLPDLAVSELRWGIRQNPQDEKPLSYIASRIQAGRENFMGAIVGMRRAFPDYANQPISSLPLEVWQLLFPMNHWSIISTQAEKVKVDPALILGLIRQESSFDVQARSSADARGLMQVLASTAPKIARQARNTRYTSKKLYQPETNIALGTHFLALLMRQYGKTELALAAYNAGNSRVDRWLREFGNGDMVAFVEQIPFSETRGYIRQVLGNQARYRLLANSAAPAAR
jgi:soluble lytic murein transglycosylase